MDSSQLFKHCVLISLLMLYKHVVSKDDPPNGFHGAERDALLALKAGFNDTFLDKNWTSIMCYMNNTPNWYGIQCSSGRVIGISLENMRLIGKVNVDALSNLTQLSTLSFKNNSISGNIMNFTYNEKLTKIDLSSNMFDGSISTSLLSLNFLESLQLQENNLNGLIPELNQSTLREFNVSKNNLSGLVPNTIVLQSFHLSSYTNNQYLCGSPSTTPCNVDNDTSKSNNTYSLDNSSESRLGIILVIVNVVGLIIIVLLFITYCKKSRRLRRELKKHFVKEGGERDGNEMEEREKGKEVVAAAAAEGGEEGGKLTFMDGVASFELGDLLKASAEGLGKGNFGNSYKALLDDGREVAVKRLRDLKPLSNEEFVKQLQVIAEHKHPNLLPLLAYYYSKDEKLLVHKLASKGNVFNRLHGGRGTKDRIPFRWSSRLSVARGVARALEYLHLNTTPQTIVPHGNLKSSNVLLDDNEVVLVSDYGLTSLISLPIAARRMVSYKSPEYLTSKRISKKSDVWSYGCLLLELLTGRVSSHAAPHGVNGVNGVDLGNWVHRAVREEWTAEIFDLEISVQRSAYHGMLRVLQVAVRCCDKSPEKRPEMAEVVREVEIVKAVVDSEDEDDASMDRSLTDESMSSATSSVVIGEER